MIQENYAAPRGPLACRWVCLVIIQNDLAELRACGVAVEVPSSIIQIICLPDNTRQLVAGEEHFGIAHFEAVLDVVSCDRSVDWGWDGTELV